MNGHWCESAPALILLISLNDVSLCFFSLQLILNQGKSCLRLSRECETGSYQWCRLTVEWTNVQTVEILFSIIVIVFLLLWENFSLFSVSTPCMGGTTLFKVSNISSFLSKSASSFHHFTMPARHNGTKPHYKHFEWMWREIKSLENKWLRGN